MKYEYLILQLDVTDGETQSILKAQGEAGWKLVSAIPLTSGGTIYNIRFYFIKEINSENQ